MTDLALHSEVAFPRLRRVVFAVGGAVLLFVAVGGFLHTKWGKPILVRVFGAACPMFNATAESVDRARQMGVALGRRAQGAEARTLAPARPALGFVLDTSKRADVFAWSKQHGVACSEEHDWLTRCTAVDPAAFGGLESGPTLDEVTFGFRPDGSLVNVSTFRRQLSRAVGDHVVQSQGAHLYQGLGLAMPPSGRVGEGTMSGQMASSTRVAVEYEDYTADLSGTELPSGVALREQYLSTKM